MQLIDSRVYEFMTENENDFTEYKSNTPNFILDKLNFNPNFNLKVGLDIE